MDLLFSGLLAVFLIQVFWKFNKPQSLWQLLMPILIILTSFGYLYLPSSMTGEGPPVFFAVTGTYFWWRRKFTLAGLLFMASFLSKYTFYLIVPGLTIWTFWQRNQYSRREIRRLFLTIGLFLLLFLGYHFLKSWADFRLQTHYVSNDLQYTLTNITILLSVLCLGAPITTILSISLPNLKNVFWLSAISALLILSRRYFYWHYPFQIIPFLLLYVFTQPELVRFIKKRFILLQALLSFAVYNLLPISAQYNSYLFPKHLSTVEMRAIDATIQTDYHGGKVGYYLNRRFDEPFPHYEISYLAPNWDFVIEDTEYVVIPSLGFPVQLTAYKQCKYVFAAQIGSNALYKVECRKG